MTIYPTVLYIKQHSVTGLKYFGKTTRDPLKYKGSGVDWRLHLKENGSEHVITLWVSEPYTDKDAIMEFALAFSRDNNIVESELWANQIPENGLSGAPTGPNGRKGIPQSTEHNQKLRKIRKGKTSPLKGKLAGPRGKQQNPADRGPRGPYGPQQNPSGPRGKQQNPHGPRGPNGKRGIPTGPQSAEHIKNATAARTGVPHQKVTCPHCGQVGGARNMKRYHFDNCKMKL